MKLLICTQKVDKNDPILGFFHRWIIEFAKYFESVIVICLQKGEYDLPQNVEVLSLGKEVQKNTQDLIHNIQNRFNYMVQCYAYAWNERANYDVVFVHMNPVYIIFLGPIWKILKKKIVFWYTHKHVDFKLRIAEKIVDKIFTASKESFRLKSKKVEIVGHGIDTDFFVPGSIRENNTVTVISVSRISPTKNQLFMIQAIEMLKQKKIFTNLIIVGGPITSDDYLYDKKIRDYVVKQDLSGIISFIGPVAPIDIPMLYQKADIFLNLSSTGSLDKAVLEAMSCNLQVITSNEAFSSIFTTVHMTDNTVVDIASKIEAMSKISPDVDAREYVVRNHNLTLLIPRLVSLMEKI